MIRSALINVMTAAALEAGRGLKRDLGEIENLRLSSKGPGDKLLKTLNTTDLPNEAR